MSDAPASNPDECRCCGGRLAERAAIVGRDRLIGTGGEFSIRVCEDCGTGRTFPIVAEADLGELYTGDYDPHAAWTAPNKLLATLQSAQRRFAEWQADRTPPLRELVGRSGQALDVGCGRGDQAARMQERGWSVFGIDPSPDAVAAAQSQGVEAETGTLGSVDFGERKFAAITFNHSLEHVYDPRADIERTAGLAAPGGLVMISVPNFGSRQRRIFGSRWFHLDLPRHRFHYTDAGLRALCEGAGLRIVKTGTSTTSSGFPGSVVYALFGRWIFTGPLSSRAAHIATLALYPVAKLIDRFGGGDVLDVVAEKPTS